MIGRIIEFSARHKIFVILATAIGVAFALQAMKHVPLDAIPDLSDTQVIIYSRWDRSPDILEDQVTYPIVSALLGAPKVKDIRAFSDFGFSYVYVIFEDGTDIYWARSRVLEYLNKIIPNLPEGVKTELGPDATGVGWVYQYALVDKTNKLSLADLRGYQDWTLRYQLQSVSGVAEIASIGGFQKEYQVIVDATKLALYGMTVSDVMDAVKSSNAEMGGRLLELSGVEHMIRFHGYSKSKEDIENAVVASGDKRDIRVKDLATVAIGPQMRRGLSDLDGLGNTVGGIVIMRFGENALNVIDRVKQRIQELKPYLPKGVEIIETYDRSDLIHRSIATLKRQLVEELIIVSLVILIFLWHIPSAIVPIVTIPVSVILAFIPMSMMGITSNIMSLAGIAISIGVLVDGAIVEVENAYKKLEEWQSGGRKGDYHAVRLAALKQVGPSVFFSLLVIAVAFLPIFALVSQEGRLFKPLAISKNLAMAIAAILAITLDPALRMLFTRMDPFHFRPRWLARIAGSVMVGKYYAEERHPISRALHRLYEPPARFALKHPKIMIVGALFLLLSCIPVYLRLGSEFMPPLNEGTILYMPTTLPGISVAQAEKLLQTQDRILKSFHEVERVHGKAGRAETSTDPAPLSMMETVVVLKPQHEWREVKRWYSALPKVFHEPLTHIWPDRISYDQLIDEMDSALRFPGSANSWTMPIKNRIDMLSTGIKTPVGVKIYGSDLKEIERIGLEVENALKPIRGVRSVFAERVAGGYFIDYELKRERLAQFHFTVEGVEETLSAAIGGEEVSKTIEGRERYPIRVRYGRDYRDHPEVLKEMLIRTPSGLQVPVSSIADIKFVQGPSMIRDENGRLSGYVYVDVVGRDVGSFVKEAKKAVADSVRVSDGYSILWSGQYENMIRVKKRLAIVVPVTILLIVLLLYMNTKSWIKTGIVLLAVPFSLVGAVWFMYFLGYNVSIATWVGMIALMGLDAETGVFMLLYLDISYKDAVKAGKMITRRDLQEAVIHGAVKRIRPKMMTVLAAMIGLLPIMWSMGAGADVMKRIAAPMIGGLFTSFIMELLIYPPIYELWKWHSEVKSVKQV